MRITAFEFDRGITAIVGPNGSGKSNLADAVRWVLGEASHLAVRSRRTEDVIFAGGRSRPAMGMAEVSLTLDNSAGLLEFSDLPYTLRARLRYDPLNKNLIFGGFLDESQAAGGPDAPDAGGVAAARAVFAGGFAAVFAGGCALAVAAGFSAATFTPAFSIASATPFWRASTGMTLSISASVSLAGGKPCAAERLT